MVEEHTESQLNVYIKQCTDINIDLANFTLYSEGLAYRGDSHYNILQIR